MIGNSHEETRSFFILTSKIKIDPKEYTITYRQIFREKIEKKLAITPGVLSLIRELRKQKFVLAIVSSSPAEIVEYICEQTGIVPYFSVRISADDVKHKKPAPAPYLVALEKLSTSPGEAVVIEDTKAGLEAAKLARIPVIIFEHAFNTKQDFSEAYRVFERPLDTIQIVNSIKALLPETKEE